VSMRVLMRLRHSHVSVHTFALANHCHCHAADFEYLAVFDTAAQSRDCQGCQAEVALVELQCNRVSESTSNNHSTRGHCRPMLAKQYCHNCFMNNI
jgi:hypothetical protein